MFTSESDSIEQRVSTGRLPSWDEVEALTAAAFERYRTLDEGVVADYIPILAQADGALFGLSVSEANGAIHNAGDAEHAFSIQSVSKAFVYALVCREYGHAVVKERIGVNNTGLPFNSVMALELNEGNPMNPMVNAGAIATTALMPGATAAEQWEFIRSGLSEFAGRQLVMDGEVYASEMATNSRNLALGRLLQSYGKLDTDPIETVDSRQVRSRRRECRDRTGEGRGGRFLGTACLRGQQHSRATSHRVSLASSRTKPLRIRR